MEKSVCVIIAARDAEATIAIAIGSALRESEVRRVVVIDDGSGDRTAAVARCADDGTERVTVVSLQENCGPSHARNLAIEISDESFVAILDADDFFLPGRFARLFAQENWDCIADNIAFFPDKTSPNEAARLIASFDPAPATLDLASFVHGNITRRGQPRGELGFLKPMMSRNYLERTRMRYDEELRLGEDYDFYARLLAANARFTVIQTCGYCAIERKSSLSGLHATEDLRRLADSDLKLLQREDLSASQRRVILCHEKETRNRYRLRHYLDLRRKSGLVAALTSLAVDPAAWLPVVTGFLLDKFVNRGTINRIEDNLKPRYIFPQIS